MTFVLSVGIRKNRFDRKVAFCPVLNGFYKSNCSREKTVNNAAMKNIYPEIKGRYDIIGKCIYKCYKFIFQKYHLLFNK